MWWKSIVEGKGGTPSIKEGGGSTVGHKIKKDMKKKKSS